MTDLISTIKSPADLKPLTTKQLQQLAREIRQELLTTVMQTGGHLASNLGVVELTLAMHSVFDSPRDQFVWDVGHQAYVHKLLTGRLAQFCTIRQFGGICGFPRREESEHDAFGTGHASTAISAALGMAVARDLKGEGGYVVAVIGDGAMTGGLAFEGVNHTGNLGTRLIVVLNDNGMSIGGNVGALAKHLNSIRSDPRYTSAKAGVERALTRAPRGGRLLAYLKKLKNGLKGAVIPTMLYEDLGFHYLGPIDGHNIAALQAALRRAKRIQRPVLVHVLTTKGKGYDPAEDDATTFHGVAPNGSKRPAAPTYSAVFGQAITQLAAEDKRIVTITASMTDGTGLRGFAKRFPERHFDVGIAEEHAVTFAAGLAARGMKPVVALYSTFLQRAYDQVVHDVCTQNLPVVFAIDRAGIVGDDGRTHQGLYDLSYLRHIPNMTIMAPADENELRKMLYTALQQQTPVAIRYPRGAATGVEIDEQWQALPLATAEVRRTGDGLAILAVGTMLSTALAVAEALSEHGLSTTVVNVRFVKPLDEALILDLAARLPLLVTIEDNTVLGGFGSAVLELLQKRNTNTPVRLYGYPDRFIEHGRPDQLRSNYGLDVSSITNDLLHELRPAAPVDAQSASDPAEEYLP